MPRPSFNHMAMETDHMATSASRMYGAPEPNPPFVFPMQPETSDVKGSSVRTDNDRGRKHMNRSRPQRISVNALPPFEFHSAADRSKSENESPAGSPSKNMPIPSHSSGHRRNGSEFIGGDGRSGLGLMSSSPTKGGETLPPPSTSLTGPPGNRRGHAHRRSGAISSHDLSIMLKPSNETRGSSAPTTPSDPNENGSFPSDIERATTQPVTQILKRDPPVPTSHRANASFEGPSRPRVGFSETIEFIPRPLSTISSETSSSLSTIRPNHSLTGSITSIVSACTPSPASSKATKSALDTMFEVDFSQPRPKTASPTLHGSEKRLLFREDSRLLKRPSSASASHRSSVEAGGPDRWRDLAGDDHPEDAQCLSTDLSARDTADIDHAPNFDGDEPKRSSQPPSSRYTSSLELKRVKRQGKVTSWAESILSRKARHDCKGNCGVHPSPSPHFHTFAGEGDFSLANVTFDEDTSCVIETPVDYDPGSSTIYTEIPPWKPSESSPISDSDTSISVLDLDATLGPFNTPTLGADADDAAAGSPVSRRRMHSSGTTGGFTGPGMHYHRRTESAPEMVAINYQVFGFPRLNSNSAMADVFEEEEEEEDLSQREGAQQEDVKDNDSIAGLGVNIVDVDDCTDPAPMRQERSTSSMKVEGLNDEEFGAVEVVEADEEPRASVMTKSSDESTITPTLSIEPYACRPASAPIDFAMSRSRLFTTPQSSSAVSSPDFNRTSFDGPRMHTANSSITDRGTLSSDVPSLISSASTMTSARASRFSSSVCNHSSSDLRNSSPPPLPRRGRYDMSKRSSRASLSRLVGSSHNEKSKLSIEERAQPENQEKPERKKHHRLSRLMRFWKSKEKLNSS